MSVGTRRDLFLGRLFFGRARADEARPAVEPSPTPEPATRAPAVPNLAAADGPEHERQDVVPLRPIAPDPTRTPPPSPALARLGAARPARPGTFAIQTNLCLAWQNVGCSTCRERCPVPNVVRTDAGRPTIDPAGCTGCGECVARCPAPILAIRFVPAAKGGAHG